MPGMDREEALKLLRDGSKGSEEWNRRRSEGEDIPNLRDASLRSADLHSANLRSANLRGANLKGANLRNADLTWASLDRANLSEADLNAANLSDATLIRANLNRANLCRSDLSGAHLGDADLSGANLYNAALIDAYLNDANLSGADLSSANLRVADLGRANLRDAVLNTAVFASTHLYGAKFANANLAYTKLAGLDLSKVNELDQVTFHGPCPISVDTLVKSKGKIPESFLRGCGVPDTWIEYLPSLLGSQRPIEIYSCFISYSHRDEEFCRRLYSRMRDEHLRVWFATERMKGGRKLHEQITTAIRLHDKLLLVLSEDSMKSEWVATEIYTARQREKKEDTQVLFPIRLVDFKHIQDWECFDADSGRDMAREIREYFIPDFSNWKDHDAFEATFARLLKDLTAEDQDKKT